MLSYFSQLIPLHLVNCVNEFFKDLSLTFYPMMCKKLLFICSVLCQMLMMSLTAIWEYDQIKAVAYCYMSTKTALVENQCQAL